MKQALAIGILRSETRPARRHAFQTKTFVRQDKNHKQFVVPGYFQRNVKLRLSRLSSNMKADYDTRAATSSRQYSTELSSAILFLKQT